MKIVVTGKTGLLSTTLQTLSSSFIFLPKEEYDVGSSDIIEKLVQIDPDVILHVGAITDSHMVNKERALAIRTNIIGTANLSIYCIQYNKRLVYVSTDYVYDGIGGNHNETDSVYPYNNYAWTKLGGECSVRMVPNHAIIRTSFGNPIFPYNKAFDNLIVSKDYVDVIAPRIVTITTSPFIGTINVGTSPKSIFEYASQRNTVTRDSLLNPMDFSLDTSLYDNTFSD